MNDIVIVSAARTPVGSLNGALSCVPAQELRPPTTDNLKEKD